MVIPTVPEHLLCSLVLHYKLVVALMLLSSRISRMLEYELLLNRYVAIYGLEYG